MKQDRLECFRADIAIRREKIEAKFELRMQKIRDQYMQLAKDAECRRDAMGFLRLRSLTDFEISEAQLAHSKSIEDLMYRFNVR